MKVAAVLCGLGVVLGMLAAPMISTAAPANAACAGKAEKYGEKEASVPKVFDTPQKEGTKVACPVTGEVFTITKDTASSTYKGKYVYFCCPGCKPKFDKDPEKYLKS